MTSILLFDFDGTIALGDGPVLAYAQQVSAALGGDDGFVDGIRSALAHADGASLDGYDAVRRAAEERGADARLLSEAYLASRRQLATGEAPIAAPDGLVEFLTETSAEAERVLVTNAPPIRIAEALDALGLAGLFDRIVTNARKPAGLDAVLADLPADARVLSIGDIWHNDLAPAHARGHATALIGGFADPAASPTYRAAVFAELIPQLRDWLRG
ncbi:HAD family hydrolase [Microbacterium hydrocarbonoxydans]|uniref:HAD family hydrolase n=1 Tax=Microbacterium hydrocarbonoxydans TaxID=273678 RepID=UPI00203BBBEB|nr:HAD family hydrolase [Microbacterium hydrocarbonoxydans]MCM3779935.1 HAD family hydrolase [Microbacterium hydrocarbonoxydans]